MDYNTPISYSEIQTILKALRLRYLQLNIEITNEIKRDGMALKSLQVELDELKNLETKFKTLIKELEK